VILPAGIVPNDFLDEPVGYILSGIKSSRLSVPLDHFFRETGQICLLTDKNMPLVWTGVSGSKNDIASWLHDFDANGDATPGNTAVNRIRIDGNEYCCHRFPFNTFSSANENNGLIAVSKTVSRAWLWWGNPLAWLIRFMIKLLAKILRSRIGF